MNNVFQRTLFKGKESLFFVLHKNSLFVGWSSNETKTSKKKAPTKREKKKKGKLIPITSIESSSSHVVAEEKKTVVVVVVDRLKNRLDSRRPRGGAARDVARGKRRGEYCLSSLPPSFFLVCVCPIVFLFVSFSAALERCDERERETNERCSDRRRKMTMI